MLIESWLAGLILLFFFVVAVISITGWMIVDQQIKEERDYSKYLEEQKDLLLEKCVKLESTVSFYKLQIQDAKEGEKE